LTFRKKILPWFLLALGGAIQAFGLYNIHALADVTEGGVLGATLLLENWFGWSPAVTGLVMNAVCYTIGLKVLGWKFIVYSAVAGLGFSGAYAICELWPPLWPQIANMPFLAATLGAGFVGVGAGLSIRFGGAPGGDDALAMSVRKVFRIELPVFYLISDLTVLLLSLTYIPWKRMLFSLYTVVLSGQIIGWMTKEKKTSG